MFGCERERERESFDDNDVIHGPVTSLYSGYREIIVQQAQFASSMHGKQDQSCTMKSLLKRYMDETSFLQKLHSHAEAARQLLLVSQYTILSELLQF